MSPRESLLRADGSSLPSLKEPTDVCGREMDGVAVLLVEAGRPLILRPLETKRSHWTADDGGHAKQGGTWQRCPWLETMGAEVNKAEGRERERERKRGVDSIGRRGQRVRNRPVKGLGARGKGADGWYYECVSADYSVTECCVWCGGCRGHPTLALSPCQPRRTGNTRVIAFFCRTGARRSSAPRSKEQRFGATTAGADLDGRTEGVRTRGERGRGHRDESVRRETHRAERSLGMGRAEMGSLVPASGRPQMQIAVKGSRLDSTWTRLGFRYGVLSATSQLDDYR
ncbi:hypothetical protein VTO42DRAFT_7776 [Malbranchea cinnamomea]